MGAYRNQHDHRTGGLKTGHLGRRPDPVSGAGASDEASEGPDRSRSIEPIAMRVPEACRYIGISRSTLYVLITQGEIEIVKLGSSTLVLTESLRQLIATRRDGADNPSSEVCD